MKLDMEELKDKALSWALEQGIDVKITLLHHYQQLGYLLAEEIIDEEVRSLAGDLYTHDKPYDGRYSRWGRNPGSIRLKQEKLPISVQRIYDHERGGTIGLKTYHRLHKMEALETDVVDGIIKGLSMSDYQAVVGQLAEGFGLTRSSVSNKFIEDSSEKLKAFEERHLDDYQFVALFIDGKSLAKEQIVIVLGITVTGDKIPMGFIQIHSEKSTPIKDLLDKLIERGLDYEKGLLCVVDGSKGICKAVEETFGSKAVIQRCQWHRRENVLNYLNEADKAPYRHRLNRAYQSETYEEAKERLEEIRRDLEILSLGAARSLAEGLGQSEGSLWDRKDPFPRGPEDSCWRIPLGWEGIPTGVAE